AFGQCFMLPFAPWLIRSEEVSAINMYRRAHLACRVRYGMDDIPPERHDVTSSKRPCACCLDRPFFPPPENIVFSASVNANYRKHLVVVRHEGHIRRPGELKYG